MPAKKKEPKTPYHKNLEAAILEECPAMPNLENLTSPQLMSCAANRMMSLVSQRRDLTRNKERLDKEVDTLLGLRSKVHLLLEQLVRMLLLDRNSPVGMKSDEELLSIIGREIRINQLTLRAVQEQLENVTP